MTRGDSGDPPTIDHRVAALRAQLIAAPQDIGLHVELADALAELVDADDQRIPVATDADEPIELLRTAATLAAHEPPGLRAVVLVNLGQKLAWRFNALLEADAPEDQLQHEVNDAVGVLRRAFDSAEQAGITDEFLGAELVALLQLVDLLRLRFRALGELDDLCAAIGYAQRILGVLAPDDEDRPGVLYRLAVDYADRYDQEADGRPADRDQAITCLREVRRLIGDDDPGRPEVATRLGLALGQRVLQRPADSSEDEFAEAIEELTLARAAPVAEQDAETSRLVRFRLGMVHAFRFLQRRGDATDRDMLLAELSELADDPDITPAQADYCRLILAYLELIRNAPAELFGITEITDLDWPAQVRKLVRSPVELGGADTARAITHQLDAISEDSAADPEFATMMGPLRAVVSLLQHPDDLSTPQQDDILSWFDDMAAEAGHSGAVRELSTIRAGLHAGFAYKRGDRAAAASAADEVIDASTALDENHPLRALSRDLLGALAGSLDLAPRSAAESSLAITRIERILAELPDDHPDRARTLTKAGASLLVAMMMDRPSVSFDRVRAMLTQSIERAAADQVNNSLNHFLLGMFNGFQGMFEHDLDLLDSGIDLLREAIRLAPEAHPVRSLIGPGMAGILYSRALLGGEQENFDAAEVFGRLGNFASSGESGEQAGEHDGMSALGDYMAVAAKLARNRHKLDQELVGEASEKMAAVVEQFAHDDPIRQVLASNIGPLKVLQSWLDMGESTPTAADLQGFQAGVDALIDASVQTPESRFDHVMDTGIAAWARVGKGFFTGDQRSLDRGISTLGRLCAAPDISPHERLTTLGCLGMGLRMRYEQFRRHQDLSNAINRLEQAQTLIAQSPPDGAEAAPILHLLGDCYHTRADPNLRDRRRAVEAGMHALRERAVDVLLQSNSERALSTAIAARGEAADVAYWCLADGSGAAAVAALELGRAIVLHFATIDAGIPAMLRESGQAELAAEWAAEPDRTQQAQLLWNLGDVSDQDRRTAELMANLSTVPVPSNLRRRVLRAVEGTDVHAQLLSAPPIADITDALRATGSSALVYLLPSAEQRPGIAVIVYPDGAVAHRELPGLRCDRGTVFDAFIQAQRELHTAVAKAPQTAVPAQWQSRQWQSRQWQSRQWQSRQWQSRLNEICDWAWTVAMHEVLSAIGRPSPGRATRLVLVPVGELGMVPWHAARRAVPGGELRYACQDAVLSYASSARQFIETARRRKPPWHSAPAVVRVGGRGLKEHLIWASWETKEIHRCFYPQGTYLGGGRKSGRATAEQVLTLLPSKDSAGASLLHLGCHAALADPPVNSHLVLAGKSRLYVREMLEQARGRPVEAPGGLVILAACASDLTGSAHDEMLTLATAFIAAGSIGVVGTRWAVGDIPTALFMVMFHHYLNRGYDDPATALRATQRWMLDKRRKLPEGIGRQLADELALLDLTEAVHWAAFTYQGQ